MDLFRRPIFAISNIVLDPWTFLWLQQRQRRAFSRCLVWLLDGFPPSRFERLHVVIIAFDLRDLEIVTDHPCDLPSRKKVFFFRCMSLAILESRYSQVRLQL